MKKKFAMFLCVLLILAMTLTACGDKQNFITALKSAAEISRYESEITVDFSVKGASDTDAGMFSSFLTTEGDTVSGKVKIDLTVNDPKNMKADLYLGDSKITDIIAVDGTMYINYRDYMSFAGGVLGSSLVPSGKDYMKLDSSSMMGISAEDIAEAEEEANAMSDSYMTALWQGISTFSTLLETAVKDVSPAVMYKEGDNYCFKLTDENITAFANNLGEAFSKDFDKLLEDYIKALKGSGDCNELAKEIEDSRADIQSEIASVASDLKEFQYEDTMKFQCSAYTSLGGKTGSRVWTLGLDCSASEGEKAFQINLKYDIKEYKDAKDISIDPSRVMTEEELAESMSSMFGDWNDYSYEEDYDYDFDDYDYDFDLDDIVIPEDME